MANYRNAEKAFRSSERKWAVNKMNISRMRTAVKKFKKMIGLTDVPAEKMGETLRQTLSLIDKSVKKGTIRENTGNRYKSRLTKRFNAVATPSK